MCGDTANTCLVSIAGFKRVQTHPHKPVVEDEHNKSALMLGIGFEGNGQLEQRARYPQFVTPTRDARSYSAGLSLGVLRLALSCSLMGRFKFTPLGGIGDMNHLS